MRQMGERAANSRIMDPAQAVQVIWTDDTPRRPDLRLTRGWGRPGTGLDDNMDDWMGMYKDWLGMYKDWMGMYRIG